MKASAFPLIFVQESFISFATGSTLTEAVDYIAGKRRGQTNMGASKVKNKDKRLPCF